MKWLKQINNMFAPGRTITGKLQDGEYFWTEVERAKFLIQNLKDDDLNWGQPYHYLLGLDRYFSDINSRTKVAELDVVRKLYLAWISITAQVDSIENSEIDPWWLYKAEAAIDHVMYSVFVYLTLTDKIDFENSLPAMHRAVNNKLNIEFEAPWIS